MIPNPWNHVEKCRKAKALKKFVGITIMEVPIMIANNWNHVDNAGRCGTKQPKYFDRRWPPKGRELTLTKCCTRFSESKTNDMLLSWIGSGQLN